MKFDVLAGGDPINATSFKTAIGYAGPSTPYDERIVQHTFINGNIQMFDIGSREEKFSEFEIILLTKQEFLDLQEFLNCNSGLKIQITEEFNDERIFMENFSTGPFPFTYFAYLLEHGTYQEDTFSIKRMTFRLKIKLSLSGLTATDEINEKNIGNLNALIKVNTLLTQVKQLTLPDPTLFVKGNRWHNTTTDEILVHSGANVYITALTDADYTPKPDGALITTVGATTGAFSTYTFKVGDKIELLRVDNTATITKGVYDIGEKINDDKIRLTSNDPGIQDSSKVRSAVGWEEFLFNLPADIPSLGFIEGIFYWAAFFTMEKASFPEVDDFPGLEEDYLSGIINHKSLKITGQSIDINKGPEIVRRQGFSFTVDDSTQFWKTIVDAKLSIFGADVSLSIFRDTDPAQTLTKIISGRNYTNQFSYSDYQFNIEPFLLGKNQEIPPTRISRTQIRYTNVRDDAVGKAPYLTYGEFDIASLQNVSKNRRIIKVDKFSNPYDVNSDSTETNVITGSISPNDGKVIFINRELASDTDFGFFIEDEVLNDINANSGFTIKIISDTNSVSEDNIEQVRVISTIEEITSPDFYQITLTNALPEIPPGPGPPPPPGTSKRIRFNIINATYRFQFNEEPSGGFGSISASLDKGGTIDIYNPGIIKLFFLAENNKDLIEIPPNNFIVNVDKNFISFVLTGVNDPSTVVNFSKIIDNLNDPLGKTIEALTTDKEDIIFTKGVNDITPPTSFTKTTYEKTPKLDIIPENVLRGIDSTILDIAKRHIFLYNAFDVNSVSIHSPDNRIPWFRKASVVDNFMQVMSRGFTIKRDSFGNNSHIFAFEISVQHFADIDDNIPVDTIVVFAINLLIQFRMTAKGRAERLTKITEIIENSGVRVILRARRKDGTYITDSNWEYTFSQKQMGTGSVFKPIVGGNEGRNDLGQLEINNLPDGSLVGNNFEEGTFLPADNWDFDVDWSFSNRGQRNAIVSSNLNSFGIGQRALIVDAGSGLPQIDRYIEDPNNPNRFIWDNGVVATIIVDDVIRLRQFNTLNDTVLLPGLSMLKWNGTSFDSAIEGVDFVEKSIARGRDLFDVSKLFTADQDWLDVEAFELLLINNDSATDANNADVVNDLVSDLWLWRRIEHNVTLKEGPFLYKVDAFNIEDRPLFSAVQGKLLTDGNFPSFPGPIIKDIMETMFPGQTDLDSIDTLMGQSDRSTWLWRRQFTSAMDSMKVVRELLENLWAVLIFNEDDKFEFVSLNPEDFKIEPKQSFNDFSILKDSIKNPKFRKIDEIFQRYELSFNFDSVSEFSSSVPKYRNSDLLADVPESTLDNQAKTVIRNSSILYNSLNIFKRDYKYHYDGDTLPIRDWIVNHYVFNSWLIKLEGTIDRILGDNPLKIMSLVSVDIFFHTGNEKITGFITGIETDIYRAKCVFTIWVPKPPGFIGTQCDPFKDALETGRTTSALPENDAGVTGRSIGSFTQDDAGNSPRGTIIC